MTLISEEILRDMDLAREVLQNKDLSTVVTKYGKIWKEKKGIGIKPFLELIDEMGEEIYGSVIGNSFLGKASALLCRYAKAGGVYASEGTKTGIALLIMGNVPCQIDKMIPRLGNINENIFYTEELLLDVESPEEAYSILKEKIFETKD